jgi:hypothetical protein
VKVPKEPKVKAPKVKVPKEPKVKVPKEPKVKVPKEPKVKAPKVKVPKEPKVKVPKEPKVKESKVNEPKRQYDIDLIHRCLSDSTESNYFKDKEIIMWIFNYLSFLPTGKNNDERKDAEDVWGRKLTNKEKDWSGPFGQNLVNEFMKISGQQVTIPEPINGLKPDLETDTHIIEVKTQTFFTPGTAGEKIMGVPFKYASVPRLFGKPLLVITLACAEKRSYEYGIFPGPFRSPEQQEMIDYYESKNIRFERFTSMIEMYVNQKTNESEPELPLLLSLGSLNLSDDDTQQV